MFTARALTQPFTIYTRWRKLFGPTRYYAIVVTADGHDLNQLLVSNGLARIYGTRTPLPDAAIRDIPAHLHELKTKRVAERVRQGTDDLWHRRPFPERRKYCLSAETTKQKMCAIEESQPHFGKAFNGEVTD